MPEISRFFGIIVMMYFNDHDPPHFHVRYGSQRARFAIDEPQMLDGDVSPRVRGLVLEWATEHRQELRDDWYRARAQQPLRAIAPLE